MRIVKPNEVDESILQSTSVENIETTWTAGTYSTGTRRVEGQKVYEVVADPNTSDQPSVGAVADPPTWVELGYSNIWRMFREGVDSLSTADGEIDVTLEWPVVVNTLGALGLRGQKISLTVTDAVDGVVYDEERDIVDIGISDWWEYYFLPYDIIDAVIFDGIPPYPGADFDLLLEGASETDPVAIGRIVAGLSRDLGVTQHGTDIQLQDYSIKERDGFGNLVLVPRRVVKFVNYDVHVPTPQVDFVVKQLQRLGAIPALYIGDQDRSSTIVFGVFADVSQGISTPSISDLTLQVEEF